MRKWEYLTATETVYLDAYRKLMADNPVLRMAEEPWEARLAKIGREGWELVNFIYLEAEDSEYVYGAYKYVFKRPLLDV
jgi:hypothetical protein